MEVVAVRGVVIGREDGGEDSTGTAAHAVEEAGPIVVALPIVAHLDPPAVGKHEGGDVDRIAGGVFAPSPLTRP
jgi:hypothetical protein